MVSLFWMMLAAHAGCDSVSAAVCSPEGIPICVDGVCDLAPYPVDRVGAVAYVMDGTEACGSGRCAFGQDAHGNSFCCQDLPDRVVVLGSELADEVSTWARPPLFDEPDSTVRLAGAFDRPVELEVRLGAGDDVIHARHRSWVDLVADGGDGNDRLIGGGSEARAIDSTLVPRRDRGRDVLIGGDGDDELRADDHSNQCSGSAAALPCGGDLLVGGRGADRLMAGWAIDELRGGPGDDRLVDQGSPWHESGVSSVLDGGPGDDRLCGGRTRGAHLGGFERLLGGPGNDVLLGRSPSGDFYDGGPGEDVCEQSTGSGCESGYQPTMDTPCGVARPDNVLVVVLDDVGTDALSLYGGNGPATPTIDSLAASGVTFDRAWSSPLCSPTRSSLMTGRHSVRTGLGRVLGVQDSFELPEAEISLAEVVGLSSFGYTSIAVGKWHLAGKQPGLPFDHPLRQGFDTHLGSISNLDKHSDAVAVTTDYFRWQQCVDGACGLVEDYATERVVDDAIAEIAGAAEPWFAYVAFNAAHVPFHAPPAHLNPAGVVETDPTPVLYRAMIQSVDLELGRLLEAIGQEALDHTTIILVSDNGTPAEATLPPVVPEEAKGTMFEGGIRVPLVVSGSWVETPGTRSDALVHVVDVLPTVAAVAGVSLDGLTRTDGTPVVIDGQSLVPFLSDPDAPGRTWNFTSLLRDAGPPPWPAATHAVRDDSYKLVVDSDGEHLYQPVGGDDGEDLLRLDPLSPAAAAALEVLRARLDEALAWPYEP